jgi:hypothetical protein
VKKAKGKSESFVNPFAYKSFVERTKNLIVRVRVRVRPYLGLDVSQAERVALRESAPGQEFEPFRFEQTDVFFHVVFILFVFEGN